MKVLGYRVYPRIETIVILHVHLSIDISDINNIDPTVIIAQHFEL